MGVTDEIRRIHGPRLRLRTGARLRALPAWFPTADFVALAALALGLAILLAFIALAPPTRLDFSVDRQPAEVVLLDFYGLERNSAGAYRWSKPSASLSVPLSAPGEYRVSLVMQDSPSVPVPRTVAIMLNGAAAGAITLDSTARSYSVAGHIAPEIWASGEGRTLTVGWETVPYVAPGDPRPLGPILTAVVIEPVARPALTEPALLVPALLLLLLGYGALRLLGVTVVQAAVLLGVPLACGAVLASLDRSRALAVSYQTIARPVLTIGVALLLTPLLFAARAWPWRWPVASPGAGASGATGEAGLSSETRGFWSRRSLPLVPILLLAFALRLWRFDRLSLWLDEGYTVGFARLAWPTVLGLREHYDVHPPLYYALTKFVSLAIPEMHAGRLVSMVAGTLTIVVLYALAARLASRLAAGVAAVVLALSPIHLWFSQEARMYALSVLFVALAYLALIAAVQERAPWWVGLYGVAVLLALYTDTSALYALVPHAFIWLVGLRVERRRAMALIGAAGLAGLCYLPWLLRSLATIETASSRQESYLAITTAKLGATALAIVGVGGGATGDGALDYWGEARTPWSAWTAGRMLIAGAILVVVAGGVAVLARRAGLAPLVVAALSAGTFGTAILAGMVAPGFAARTLLYAVCGWALLVGVAWSSARSRRQRAVVCAGLCGLLLLSTLTLGAIVQTGTKQGYRDLAAATAAAIAAEPLPLLTNDQVTATLIDVYAPQALAARHDAVTEHTVDAVVARYRRDPGALWFAYGDYPWRDSRAIGERLVALGFERRSHQYFRGGLYLDLYAQTGAWYPGESRAAHRVGYAASLEGQSLAFSFPARYAAGRPRPATEGNGHG